MPRVKQPKFTGPLAERIRVSILPVKGETAAEYVRRWTLDFGRQAMAKVPLLVCATFPDMPPFDPQNPHEAVIAIGALCADQAQRLGVRGFMPAPIVKRHPFLVRNALENIELNKAADRAAGRRVRSDLEILLLALSFLEAADYKTLTGAERRRRARRWSDLVSAERARQRRRAQKKLH